MPQSVRPARIVWAMSGPVGHGGATTARSSNERPSSVEQRQQQLRAGSLRPHRQAGAARQHVADGGDRQWIAGSNQETLLASGKVDQHGVVKAAALLERLDVGVALVCQRVGDGWRLRRCRRARTGRAPLRCLPARSQAPSRSHARPIRAADRGCHRRSASDQRASCRAAAPGSTTANDRVRIAEKATCRSPWYRGSRLRRPVHRFCVPSAGDIPRLRWS
jgi:hypothetical protein